MNVIGLSGGKDSTALALRMQEVEPGQYEYIFTPAGNEPDSLKLHIQNLEKYLDGAKVIWLGGIDDRLEQRIRHYNTLPNHRIRWCTRELKIVPAIQWLKAHAPLTYCVGLRADEEERPGIYGDIPGVTIRYPLREWGWGVEDVWGYLAERGVKIPKRTGCKWCYGQTLGDWYRLYRDDRQSWEQAKDLETLTGHTFRSPQRDTWPAALKDLEVEFETRIPNNERRPGSIQLDLFDQGETELQPCRVCSL